MAEVQIISKERLLDKFFAVDEVRFRVQDGVGVRYVVETRNAAAILLHKLEDDKLVLIYQHRIPYMLRHDEEGWLYEIPAGVFEDNENAEACIIRESIEETGYKPSKLEFIGKAMVSPGYTTEEVTLYYARVSEEDKVESGGGLAAEHELLKVVEIPVREAFDMLASNKIRDAKTMIALLWLKNTRQSSGDGHRSSVKG